MYKHMFRSYRPNTSLKALNCSKRLVEYINRDGEQFCGEKGLAGNFLSLIGKLMAISQPEAHFLRNFKLNLKTPSPMLELFNLKQRPTGGLETIICFKFKGLQLA